MSHNHRIQAVLQALGQGEPKRPILDALLISGLPNIRYLSGFTGSNALLLITPAAAILFTDPRYTLQAGAEVSCEVRIAKDSLTGEFNQFAKRRKFKRLGVERNRISFEAYDTLQNGLPSTMKLVPVGGVVEEVRMTKSAEEIERIRQSVETNSRAFRRALKAFQPGMRESELASEIDYQQRRAGAQSSAFETIVASGPRSAFPHARPTREKIGSKAMLLIDMGAFENAYASDMTRTLHVGKATKRFKQLYNAVREAQLAAIDAVHPGVPAGKVDAAARAVLTAAGFGEAFVHSTGHGVGLEIHEEPRIGKNSTTILQPGFAITIEPGAYIEHYGGVRIEDTVIVTESGCEVLTPTSKDLVEL